MTPFRSRILQSYPFCIELARISWKSAVLGASHRADGLATLMSGKLLEPRAGECRTEATSAPIR